MGGMTDRRGGDVRLELACVEKKECVSKFLQFSGIRLSGDEEGIG